VAPGCHTATSACGKAACKPASQGSGSVLVQQKVMFKTDMGQKDAEKFNWYA
jgi:hypothetical protein